MLSTKFRLSSKLKPDERSQAAPCVSHRFRQILLFKETNPARSLLAGIPETRRPTDGELDSFHPASSNQLLKVPARWVPSQAQEEENRK